MRKWSLSDRSGRLRCAGAAENGVREPSHLVLATTHLQRGADVPGHKLFVAQVHGLALGRLAAGDGQHLLKDFAADVFDRRPARIVPASMSMSSTIR